MLKNEIQQSHGDVETNILLGGWAGCMFHSEEGLKSFEHPMNKMKAMPRTDSEGLLCGASFKVDVYTKINSMPRVGSEANWATWGGPNP